MENMQSSLEKILTLFNLSLADFWMIFVCTFGFFLFWKAAERVLFGPLLQLFETRERLTTGAASTSTEKAREAERLESQFEQELMNARVLAVQKKMEALRGASRVAESIVSDAEQLETETLERERVSIEETRAKLLASLSGEVEALAQSIVNSIRDPKPSDQREVAQ